MDTRFLDLKNKNVVITGGAGFLGGQISGAFLKQGSKVFVLDLKKPKGKFTYFKTDITSEINLKKVLAILKKKKY